MAARPPIHQRLIQISIRDLAPESFQRAALLEFGHRFDYLIAFFSGDYAAARSQIEAAIKRVEALKPSDKAQLNGLNQGLAFLYYYLANTEYILNDYTAAGRHARKSVEHRKADDPRNFIEKSEASRERVLHGLALARLGRAGAEAMAILDPEIKAHRELRTRGSEGLESTCALCPRAVRRGDRFAGSGAHLARRSADRDGPPADGNESPQ
jgi:hypothetical protein